MSIRGGLLATFSLLALVVASSSWAVTAGGPGTAASADQLAAATPDVHYIVHWLDYNGHYQLQIENLSPIGAVTSLTWVPPPSLRVTAISSSQGGNCTVADSGGISCKAQLRPPSCDAGACESAASIITVKFTAALTGTPPGSTFSDLMWGSFVQVTGMTVEPSSYSDLPRCRKGTLSTRKHPCAPNG
jgi:hypothetical protein